jgi:hypothetical protein
MSSDKQQHRNQDAWRHHSVQKHRHYGLRGPRSIANYTAEILNTFDVSGLPPNELNLKVGVIVILLKNIDSRYGLCNGTQLLIKFLTDVIVATIITGKHKDRTVLIPPSMSPL